MKKHIKIIFIIFIILMFSFNSFAYADNDIIGRADRFLNDAYSPPSSDGMKSAIQEVAGILMGIAVVLIVIVGAVLGIQFMLGGAEEQAKIKQSLIPYIIGSTVVFGATGIFNIVVRFLNQAT